MYSVQLPAIAEEVLLAGQDPDQDESLQCQAQRYPWHSPNLFRTSAATKSYVEILAAQNENYVWDLPGGKLQHRYQVAWV